ncbi:hypothetical protein [Cumulibacter soli]|uniref:hypothetical protein n=1 Tax=Cumulibacter soli TaxID=2546344 RepID=UPI0010674A79|nr:hypothetical protein [Cumulibacter soli]
MSFLDPYAAGDPNPDELNPYFVHLCAAGAAACGITWMFLDNLMVRIVLAAILIGLLTAIAVRGVTQVDPDAPAAHEREGATRAVGPGLNQPLVRLPKSLRD